jgi:hypothetical protein
VEGVRRKKTGKLRDQKARSGPGAGDVDTNVGSRAKRRLSAWAQERVGTKETGKPRDQKARDIDSGAGDVDANVGSRAKRCLSIRTQERVGTNKGSRGREGSSRGVVTAMVDWRYRETVA